MTSDRIEEIQKTTAYPESRSVLQALLQVWNECEQEQNKKIREVVNRFLGIIYRKCKVNLLAYMVVMKCHKKKLIALLLGLVKRVNLFAKNYIMAYK